MTPHLNPHVYPRECAFKSIEDIKGKKVTVMGLGLNGGGEAAVRFFLNKGAFVTVTDMKTAEQLSATVEKLNNDKSLDLSRLTYRLGEHRIEDFENADCVIKNPGVKIEGNKYLAAARAIESDLSIFLRFTDCPVIAVTGSKGKSSTVSAIYYGLKEAGFKAFLGGNITVSPLTFFDQVSSDTPVVIEFSSWQLADLRGRGVLKPHISVITKIVPDHQNWYGNMEDYVADKRLIYADQTRGDYSIFDAEGDQPGTEPDKKLHPGADTWGNLFASESKGTVLRYGRHPLTGGKEGGFGVWLENTADGGFEGKVLLPKMKEAEVIMKGLSVPGDHMKTNVLNAALVMYLMGVPAPRVAEICSRWQGIEHRLQFFHSWTAPNGKIWRFYNDSCATVPEAAAAASQAFEKSVTLMTGGTDKGLDLLPLERVLCAADPARNEHPVKDLYLLAGSATDKLLPPLRAAGIKFHGPFNSLEELLQEAKANMSAAPQSEPASERDSAEVFVFSPGATSFGMFQNEFDRGNKYMAAVKTLFAPKS
ncbi:MAG: UDP-N-acetylmuramoyl-L-alanine--D-glutamate ligase [Treponema sp.]|nr:UDP-N-acetylmuramoyl-L-alanine--D-glutamate ligase [Treponema sp.]